MRRPSVIIALLTALTVGSTSLAASADPLTDGTLRASVPETWSRSVSYGTEAVARRDYTVAWLLVGNFSFPHGAASREGGPAVPVGHVLVAIGDFVATARSRHWPSVRRVRIPVRWSGRRRLSWSVRFAGRALRLSVAFGSPPTARLVAEAGAVLASLTRCGAPCSVEFRGRPRLAEFLAPSIIDPSTSPRTACQATVMAAQRERREAAGIPRRIAATLPEPTPTRVAFRLGQPSGLDEESRVDKKRATSPQTGDQTLVVDV